MSVEVTRLPSGLTVVTDAMPHLETASLGVWVGAGSRDERQRRARHLAPARTHGVQGHQAAHRAADRRGDRGRRRRSQCRDLDRDHGLLCARAQGRRAARARRALRHPRQPGLRSGRAQREQNVIVQEIGAAEDTPDDIVFDYLQAAAFPDQPIGRSILGTPRKRALLQRPTICAHISRAIIAPPTWSWSRPARSTTR